MNSSHFFRTHECHDTTHSCSWDFDVRMAICTDQRIVNRGHRHLWVSHQSSTTDHPPFFLFGIHTLIIIRRFSSGSYVSLVSNPMMALGDTKDVGRRLGMFSTVFSLGALAGPPISGAINTATGSFKAVGYYAGVARS